MGSFRHAAGTCHRLAGAVGTAAAVVSLLVGAGWLPGPTPVRADVFHLSDGSTVEGLLVEQMPTHLRIKTGQGYVLLDRGDVLRQEPKPTPWPQYQARLARTPDNPQGHLELARWCQLEGLATERDEHLRRALRLDAEFEPAYRELGLVRVGLMWLDATVRPTPEADAPPDVAGDDVEKLLAEEEQLVREVITGWFVRIRAIKSAYLLEPGTPQRDRLFSQGAERILRIRDPLAIPAIASVLAKGNVAARLLMVEALSNFPQDDATLNLLMTAVFDPDQEVRLAASLALAPRKEERLVNRLRAALGSEHDNIIRNAAFVLGRIRARQAVPDLVNVLTTTMKVTQRVPLYGWISGTRRLLCTPTRLRIGGMPLAYGPRIVVLCPGSRITTGWTTQRRVVTVFRTEVQEALIEITGQNLGFDADAWLRWHAANP